jgi:HEAT repeat protein
LESSIQKSQTRVSCTLVRVFGQLGDERAVPRLCTILERRPVLRRAHWHTIQLVTIDALAVLPTKDARRSIERAALHGTQSTRARAFAALKNIV